MNLIEYPLLYFCKNIFEELIQKDEKTKPIFIGTFYTDVKQKNHFRWSHLNQSIRNRKMEKTRTLSEDEVHYINLIKKKFAPIFSNPYILLDHSDLKTVIDVVTNVINFVKAKKSKSFVEKIYCITHEQEVDVYIL